MSNKAPAKVTPQDPSRQSSASTELRVVDASAMPSQKVKATYQPPPPLAGPYQSLVWLYAITCALKTDREYAQLAVDSYAAQYAAEKEIHDKLINWRKGLVNLPALQAALDKATATVKSYSSKDNVMVNSINVSTAGRGPFNFPLTEQVYEKIAGYATATYALQIKDPKLAEMFWRKDSPKNGKWKVWLQDLAAIYSLNQTDSVALKTFLTDYANAWAAIYALTYMGEPITDDKLGWRFNLSAADSNAGTWPSVASSLTQATQFATDLVKGYDKQIAANTKWISERLLAVPVADRPAVESMIEDGCDLVDDIYTVASRGKNAAARGKLEEESADAARSAEQSIANGDLDAAAASRRGGAKKGAVAAKIKGKSDALKDKHVKTVKKVKDKHANDGDPDSKIPPLSPEQKAAMSALEQKSAELAILAEEQAAALALALQKIAELAAKFPPDYVNPNGVKPEETKKEAEDTINTLVKKPDDFPWWIAGVAAAKLLFF